MIARNPSEVAPFPDLFAADTPGKVATAAPMLVYQGLSDDVVYKVFTDQYVQKACALGNTVEYKTFTGKDHYEENDAAEKDVLEWMQARLAGAARTVHLLTARAVVARSRPGARGTRAPWMERARSCTRPRSASAHDEERQHTAMLLEATSPHVPSLGSNRVLSVDLPPEPSSATQARRLARAAAGVVPE